MANSKFSKKRYSNKHRQRKNSRKNMRGGSSTEVVTRVNRTGETTFDRPTTRKIQSVAKRAKNRHRDKYDLLKTEYTELTGSCERLLGELLQQDDEIRQLKLQLQQLNQVPVSNIISTQSANASAHGRKKRKKSKKKKKVSK